MSIEVKQLVVKADLHSTAEPLGQDARPAVDLEAFREEILAECRRMLEQMLEQRRER